MLEYIKKEVLPLIAAQLPYGILHKCTGSMPLFPYYHVISDEEVPHVKHLYRCRSVREFKSDLDMFLRSYRAITLHELLRSIDGRQALPRNAFMLTFDDGFRQVYDVIAPILLEKGVPATFFIIKNCLDNADMAHHNKISLLLEHLNHSGTDVIKAAVLRMLSQRGIHEDGYKAALFLVDYANKDVLQSIAELVEYDFEMYLRTAQPYLRAEQVRNLIKRGFTVGGHSIDHPLYEKLPLQEQLRQTRESVQFIRTQFNLGYNTFAFPHHDTGVSRKFFDEIYSQGEMDVSFGTAGMVKDQCHRHLQRFAMEKTAADAERIVAYNYARSMQKRLLGRHTVVRA